MKIVIDKDIPFCSGLFESYAEVAYLDGAAISRADVADADALLVHNRTRCDSALLEGSRVKIIATSTIGTNHIDLPWCHDNGVCVRNAAGCNAGGVMNYVISATYGIAARKSINLEGATFGVIGMGSTGARVAQAAISLGFKLLSNDPPRAEAEDESIFCSLDRLLAESDIVSLHIPLNCNTENMAGREFFARMKPGAIFINTSRGEIVDEQALIEAIPRLGGVVIDNWRNEPDINLSLMELTDIATPHIAGYSLQGMQFGTAYAVRSIARFLEIPDSRLTEYIPEVSEELRAVKLNIKDRPQGQKAAIIQYNYPIFTDNFMFRMAPENFSLMRSRYNFRREFYLE